MAAPKGITEARIRAALRKHAGIYSLAAKELGCDRSNVEKRVNASPELQAFVASLEQEVLDLADAIIIDGLSEKTVTGKPTKEARNMARWRRDHELRKRGVQLRIAASAGGDTPALAGDGAPVVNVLISYRHGGEGEK